MQKAYDIKALGQKIQEKMKAKGLTVAEEAVEETAACTYEGFKEWFKESAAMSTEGPLAKADDFIAMFVDQLDPVVMPQITKIDLDKDGD